MTAEIRIDTLGGAATVRPPQRGGGIARRVNRFFRRARGVAAAVTLGPAVLWLLLIYVASLVMLVWSARFEIDDFTFKPTDQTTTENFEKAFLQWDYFRVVLRSVGIAAAVTALCLAIALPVTFYISKLAKPWAKRALIVSCLLPLWAGYLVKGYAWKALLRPSGQGADGGFLQSVFGYTPGFGMAAVVLALTYLWLPYMILPIYAGLERLPVSLLDAAGDLGAKPGRMYTSVVIPMLVPSIAAGSIFTFSLSLGDYIMPRLVTEGKVTMVGNVIYSTLLAPNQPLAAAYTIWPLLIILAYLLAMKRAGAFESL